MKPSEKERFKYLVEYKLRQDNQLLFEEFINEKEQKRYTERFFEMNSFIENEEEEIKEQDSDSPSAIEQIENNNFETNNTEAFKNSISQSSKGEFLTPYSDEDFSSMKTFKLKGYNIGFAIKSDGDIVSVHNNSGIKGLGIPLMKAAIKNGGKKLDHFDGFLTGLYSKLGFKVVSADEWNDDYAPSGWKYNAVNPFDENTSAYAHELSKYKNNPLQIPDKLKSVIKRYQEGKPDIVYRSL